MELRALIRTEDIHSPLSDQTIPIVCRGQFVGSVQLSRDVTNMGRSGRAAPRVSSAFTGAEDRAGLIEECSGGTIYLGEINSMPLKLQSKLLRVLDTKTVMPLGAIKPKDVDIRIVASVNRSPEQLMQNKKMLPDLFFRLNAIHIRVPPLRSRPEDIELQVADKLKVSRAKLAYILDSTSSPVCILIPITGWGVYE